MGVVNGWDCEVLADVSRRSQLEIKTYITTPELWHADTDSSARTAEFGTSRQEDWLHPSACGNEWDELFPE